MSENTFLGMDKKFVYIYLNSKNRIIFANEQNKANVLSWVNLPAIPPGKGKLKLVMGNFRSSVNRNHRFNLQYQSGAFNYYSSDQLASVIAEIVPFQTNIFGPGTMLNFNFIQRDSLGVLADAKDLQNINLVINFTTPVTTSGPPSAIRPILDGNNQFNFVLKFEYD